MGPGWQIRPAPRGGPGLGTSVRWDGWDAIEKLHRTRPRGQGKRLGTLSLVPYFFIYLFFNLG